MPTGHGGKRPGSGHPTKFQMEQKEAAAKEKQSAAKAKRKAALAASWENIETAAAAGERWAIELLLNHEIGKPTQKASVVEDTNIRLLVRWPKSPLKCPHCGKIVPANSAGKEPDGSELASELLNTREEDDSLASEHDWIDPFEADN